MKTAKEPECKKYPHSKVKKPPTGTTPEEDGMHGEVVKGVDFYLEVPLTHKVVMENHKFTAIMTSVTKKEKGVTIPGRVVKIALDHKPNKQELRRLWKDATK